MIPPCTPHSDHDPSQDNYHATAVKSTKSEPHRSECNADHTSVCAVDANIILERGCMTAMLWTRPGIIWIHSPCGRHDCARKDDDGYK